MRFMLASAFLWFPVSAARAHGSGGSSAWASDPWIVLPLLAAIGLYAAGTTKLWSRAGPGRGVQPWRALCFVLGWLLLAGALASPLHELGKRLFTAHMIEHEMLMVMAAPLLVLARPFGAMLWALPPAARRALGGVSQVRALRWTRSWATDPLVATVLHGAALWLWHMPGLYEAALASETVHWLQHFSFFATALLFWQGVIYGRTQTGGQAAGVFYLFLTALHSGFLGILLSIARVPLFPGQGSSAAEWGMTVLEDQQLAGLIMWVPGGLVYAAAALSLTGLWIANSGAAGSKRPLNV
jgi:putative membrane protein